MNRLNLAMTMPQQADQSDEDEIDLFAIAGTIWRGKLWILLTVLISIIFGGYYATEIATPLYQGKSVVALQTKQQQVLDIESVLSGASGGSEEVNTEVEVIRSRILMTSLVDTLNLVQDPEFNFDIRETSKFNPIAIIRSLFNLKKKVRTEEEILNSVIDQVVLKISVLNIRKSVVFVITATTENSKKSALIANTLADLYIQDSFDKKIAATEKASKWLSKKAAELKIELEDSEIQVKRFSDSSQLISADALGALSIQLKEMRDRILDLETKRSRLQTSLDLLEGAIYSEDLPLIVKLTDDLELTDMFNNGDVNDAVNKTAFILKARDILNKMRVDVTRAARQYESMLNAGKELQIEIENQSADLVQLQQLEREATANGLLYESFLTRLKETSVQQGLQKPDSRLLSRAVPRKASSPRLNIVIILSILIGGIIGVSIVLLRELRNNTFRTATDLEDFTGYGVLGSIPRTKAATRKDILSYAREKPTSVFAEAIRNLRTSVLLSDVDSPPQVLMSTSSVPGEGKTTTSLTLAQNMAGLGKKVLVVEGDVRKRIFEEYFNVKNKNGFMAVMSGESSLEDAVFKPADMGVDILIGEQSNINAADIFSSAKFTDFVKTLRNNYDYIIIDTAPVLAVPDARVIGQHVDAILYSVLWNSTTKTQVKQGLSMFESVGLQVSGLVLGNIDSKEMKRYGYAGQYGYAYGDTSGYHED